MMMMMIAVAARSIRVITDYSYVSGAYSVSKPEIALSQVLSFTSSRLLLDSGHDRLISYKCKDFFRLIFANQLFC